MSQQSIGVLFCIAQVKDRLKALLQSGQQSFTEVGKNKSSSTAAGAVEDKVQAQKIISATEPPLASSGLVKTGSGGDRIIDYRLHDVPEGCVASRCFSY